MGITRRNCGERSSVFLRLGIYVKTRDFLIGALGRGCVSREDGCLRSSLALDFPWVGVWE